MNNHIFSALTEIELQMPFYATSAGGWLNQEAMNRKEGFPDFQWIQTLSGQGMLVTEGSSFIVAKHQGMLLFPHAEHHYYAVQEPWEVVWVTFNGQYVRQLLETMHMRHSEVLYISNPDHILGKIKEIHALMHSNDPLRNFESSALAYQIVLDLFMYGSSSEIRSKQQHYEQLEPVLAFIEEHYSEDLTLEELAQKLSVSSQHTCLLFQRTLGMRPFEYIKRVRLRKAKELLIEDTKLEVHAVARIVGYAHASYFIKLFKQAEGVTPSMFRSIHR